MRPTMAQRNFIISGTNASEAAGKIVAIAVVFIVSQER